MGKIIKRGNKAELQLCAESARSWTSEKRTRFLNHLAATSNVEASVAVVGMSTAGAYMLRRRDPAFAAQWHAAVLAGYDRLEAALLEHATRALTAIEHDEVPDQPFDPREALQLLSVHHGRQRATQRGRIGRPAVKRATPAETDTAILKALAVLDRRLKAKAARGEAAQE